MKTLEENIAERIAHVQSVRGFSDAEASYLKKHQQVSYAELDVDGETYPAWRIIHNQDLGPGKGGIRFHPGVNEDEVKALSFWMSLKNSLAGLPYGGAKGGVQFNPKEKTQAQIEAISRAYIRAFADKLGEHKDIPAPDVYTTPQIMGWMLDEFEKEIGQHQPAMITGKPLSLNGIPLRGAATAEGGRIISHLAIEQILQKTGTLTVAVQGFGNAGAHVAHMLHADGLRLVALSDSKGAVHLETGLDPQRLDEIKRETGSVQNYPKAQKLTNAEMLELKVDVLVLAALENQVTGANAKHVKAGVIIELANGPVSPEADDILFKKGITVVPDILANSGGVVVSYFEWVQNKVGSIFDDAYLETKLRQIMERSWQRVLKVYEESGRSFDLRSAAYVIGIDRILEAAHARGKI